MRSPDSKQDKLVFFFDFNLIDQDFGFIICKYKCGCKQGIMNIGKRSCPCTVTAHQGRFLRCDVDLTHAEFNLLAGIGTNLPGNSISLYEKDGHDQSL